MSEIGAAAAPGVPEGWYPDPGGTTTWRRWEGTTWGEATMPFGTQPPDEQLVVRERLTWPLLRAIAPWALAAQAAGALVLATQTAVFSGLRQWVRAYQHAVEHNLPRPPVPANAIGQMSTGATLTYYVVLLTAAFGIMSWLRFSAASIHVARSTGYRGSRNVVVPGLLFFIPVVGPLVAMATSRSTLPSGHEAGSVLMGGWGFVALAELGWIAVFATLTFTASEATALVVAGLCAACWLLAAALLPLGLQAIVDDHATLGVRSGPAYS